MTTAQAAALLASFAAGWLVAPRTAVGLRRSLEAVAIATADERDGSGDASNAVPLEAREPLAAILARITRASLIDELHEPYDRPRDQRPQGEQPDRRHHRHEEQGAGGDQSRRGGRLGDRRDRELRGRSRVGPDGERVSPWGDQGVEVHCVGAAATGDGSRVNRAADPRRATRAGAESDQEIR